MANAALSDAGQVPVSCDSHVVEAREVFAGLTERFGDEAPRIATVGDEVDAMVIPARGGRVLGAVKAGIASTRMKRAWNFSAARGINRRRKTIRPPNFAKSAGAASAASRKAWSMAPRAPRIRKLTASRPRCSTRVISFPFSGWKISIC